MLTFTPGASGSGALSILCLGAHSDDIEIGCGGALLRLLAERPNCSVHWVVFSAAGEREREARASADAFLAAAGDRSVLIENVRESYFPYVAAEIKDLFEKLKKTVDPDVVFTHHRHDVHQDHRVVAELTWNTFRNHVVLEYEIPKYEGDLGTPNVFVPLDEMTVGRKIQLLLQHFATQRARRWFRADTFHGLMRLRGVECNALDGFAEAFHVRKLVL